MQPNDIKLFYDVMAEHTANEWYQDEVLMPSLKEFLNLIDVEKPRILDLGCGPGHESMRLAREGAEVIGVDFSPKCIEIAKKNNPNGEFHEMDFFKLNKSLGMFDGILAAASLIHIPADQLTPLLEKLYDSLNINGCFLAIMKFGEGETVRHHNINDHEIKRIIYNYTDEPLIDLFQKAKLQFVKLGYLADNLIKQNWRSYLFKKI